MTELEQIEKTPKKVPARQKSKKKEIPKASESDVELELTSLEAEDLQIKKPTSKSGKSKKELQMSPEESVLEKDETKLRSQSGPGQDKAVRAVDTEEFQADRAEAETKKCQTVVAAPVTAAEEEMEVSHTRGRTWDAASGVRMMDFWGSRTGSIPPNLAACFGLFFFWRHASPSTPSGTAKASPKSRSSQVPPLQVTVDSFLSDSTWTEASARRVLDWFVLAGWVIGPDVEGDMALRPEMFVLGSLGL